MGDVRDLKVAVLSGGWSDEREVSLDSGTSCKHALEQAGFSDVRIIDIADEEFLPSVARREFDLAFVALHGRYGEDGCIQGLLEVADIPYTFSGVLASSLASEKDMAKSAYQAAGLEVPRGARVAEGHLPTDDELARLVEELGLPLFVKPAANGSSFGVTRVEHDDELAAAIATAGEEGGNVLVEQCVVGTEVTVAVLGNEDPEPLPVVEIVTGADFYDSTVKYENPELHHVIPARLGQATYEKVQQTAVAAHKALGCAGASRTDIIVREDGTPVVLETNTIPGMTEASLLPDAGRHAGIEFPEMCRKLVELALEAHRGRRGEDR